MPSNDFFSSFSWWYNRYPAINKPAAVLHWLNHADIEAEFIVILDADMILRGPITPWEFQAARGRPVSAPYEYDEKVLYLFFPLTLSIYACVYTHTDAYRFRASCLRFIVIQSIL